MAAIDMGSPDGRREALKRMVTIREFEESVADLFEDGEIPGFVHLYSGQEAVAVGACAALESDDYITSTHRGHGHCIAKGLEPSRMMAELFGAVDGYCSGKGGSMHIADTETGMLGANGIVGAGAPIATGAAFTIQYHDGDSVALSFFGDASIASGQVHEAINLAATWELPAVFLIENNQYGEFQPFDEQHNIKDLSRTAGAYGIEGVSIDGMDLTEVYQCVVDARKRARDGEPTLIEAETYRYRGHYEGDPEVYRDKEEKATWRERDPIERFKQQLVESGELTEEEFDQLASEARDIVDDAVQYGRNSSLPDVDAAYQDMYSEPVPDIGYFRRQMGTGGRS